MKILAYSVRPDEIDAFNEFSSSYGHNVKIISTNFSPQVAHLAEGYEGVSILGNDLCNREALETLSKLGVKYIGQRVAGTDNIDIEAASELGIKAANVPAYSPNSVSEFTVGLILSLTRNIPYAIKRAELQDFSLGGLLGIEVRNLTIGVVGTGRIGINVIKALSGFGCEILANDIYENEEVKKLATYVSLDEIYEKSDVITLHLPLFDESKHMINDESIEKMKKGVYIINAARGGLVDPEALLRGLKSGKVGKAAIDTYEREYGIVHHSHIGEVLQDDTYARLLQMPNVVITPHMAFYTDEAVSNMVEISLSNLRDFETTDNCNNEIK